MWAALSHICKGFCGERLACGTKFATVVFQTGAREISPSSFPTFSFTFHQVAADRQKYTSLSHCCLLRTCNEEHLDLAHQQRLSGTRRKEIREVLLRDIAKRKPTQPAPSPDTKYLPKSRVALTPHFLSCTPSGGQCAHHHLRRSHWPLPESHGQGAGWPSASPPQL